MPVLATKPVPNQARRITAYETLRIFLLLLENGGAVNRLALGVLTRLCHSPCFAILRNHGLGSYGGLPLQFEGSLGRIGVDPFVRERVGVWVAFECIVLAVVLRLKFSMCRFAVRPNAVRCLLDAIIAPGFDLECLALGRHAGGVVFGFS